MNALNLIFVLTFVHFCMQLNILPADVLKIQLELVPMIQEIISEWLIVHFFTTTPSEAVIEDFSSQLSLLHIGRLIFVCTSIFIASLFPYWLWAFTSSLRLTEFLGKTQYLMHCRQCSASFSLFCPINTFYTMFPTCTIAYYL